MAAAGNDGLNNDVLNSFEVQEGAEIVTYEGRVYPASHDVENIISGCGDAFRKSLGEFQLRLNQCRLGCPGI